MYTQRLTNGEVVPTCDNKRDCSCESLGGILQQRCRVAPRPPPAVIEVRVKHKQVCNHLSMVLRWWRVVEGAAPG